MAELARGNSSELVVSFSRPTAASRMSAHVLLDESGALESGIEVFIDFTPPEESSGGQAVVVVGTRPGCVACNRVNETLPLLPGETEISMRVFVDRKSIECYWMDGRVALTVGLPPGSASSVRGGVALSASVGVKASATLWEMGSIWATPAEVLATPRPDEPK